MQILKAKRPDTNVGEAERWASIIGGGAMVEAWAAREGC